MAIGSWSRRQILISWLLACAVQASFVGLAVWSWYRVTNAAAATLSTHGAQATQPDSATRAGIDRLLRDSLGIEFQRRGDTITSVSLSGRGDSIATTLSGAMIGIVWEPVTLLQLAVGILAFFSPLLLAAVITLAWRRKRAAVGPRSAQR
jgi:hypothetical protein